VICSVPGVEQCDLLCRGSRLLLFHVKWIQHLRDTATAERNAAFFAYIGSLYHTYDPKLLTCLSEGWTGDLGTCNAIKLEM
jgi:hypothetical protein